MMDPATMFWACVLGVPVLLFTLTVVKHLRRRPQKYFPPSAPAATTPEQEFIETCLRVDMSPLKDDEKRAMKNRAKDLLIEKMINQLH